MDSSSVHASLITGSGYFQYFEGISPSQHHQRPGFNQSETLIIENIFQLCHPASQDKINLFSWRSEHWWTPDPVSFYPVTTLHWVPPHLLHLINNIISAESDPRQGSSSHDTHINYPQLTDTTIQITVGCRNPFNLHLQLQFKKFLWIIVFSYPHLPDLTSEL